MSNPRINGYCPACGQAELVMDYATADLRCGVNGCSRPTAAQEILGDGETEHVVELLPTGFTIQHPLRERLDHALMHCPLHTWLMTHRPAETSRPGLYRAYETADGWTFVAVLVETQDDVYPGT